MKELLRRVVRLEGGWAHSDAGVDAEAQAAAYATLTEVMSALAAEKAAGDVHGTAGRYIAKILAEVDRQA